jgi:4-alpha-glucanotransferase
VTEATGFLDRRRAGILLHPTSLPGGRASGSLGPDAYRFVDFLAASGMSLWQMLPLGPTHLDGSPYQCLSVHAGNSALISLRQLAEWGWLGAEEVPAGVTPERRRALLGHARAGFERHASEEARAAYGWFVGAHTAWLDDFALYMAVRDEQGGAPWLDWPAPLRDREAAALARARSRLADAVEQVRFEQFIFFRQWLALRHYANERDILLFGDVPIFVAHDSAEVWAHREYFALDEHGTAQFVAGVPPDYFSATGQRWGNPHYDWERMQAEGFRWWVERLRTQLELFDLVRVDHFRGFESYWEIPAAAETAVEGRWVKAPGAKLFKAFTEAFPRLPLVAEDLGVITPEVEALRRRYRLPGMKVLVFAFDGGADNPYLPHNHVPDCVAYTGTHDNDTTRGWFDSLDAESQAYVCEYLGSPAEPMPWPLVRAALASVADLAVVPLQDVLGLGSEHRMNTPGTASGNWTWRFNWEQVPDDLAARLRRMAEIYGRLAASAQ